MRIGLTGGIASGKSTVAEVWAGLGACVIDADVLARDVVAPGTPGERAVLERFPSVGTPAGIDRAALGAIIFADEGARRDLEAIIHPGVLALSAQRESVCRRAGRLPVHVIPLLVETMQAPHYAPLVVVDVDPAVQLSRLMARNQLTRTQAQARIDAQASRAERLAVADIIILNDGTLADLRAAAARTWMQIQTSHLLT